MEKIFERLFKNWKTTIGSVVVIIVFGVLMYTGTITTDNVMHVIMMCGGTVGATVLMASKDPKKK